MSKDYTIKISHFANLFTLKRFTNQNEQINAHNKCTF